MKTINFALVGTGNIAHFHARAIAMTAGAKLVAVHSRREDAGRDFAGQYGAEYFADYAILLKNPNIDAVCITTPSGTHGELGILAARAKKHVLCEKPLEITPARIDELVDVCAQNEVQLGATFQARFGVGALALKRAAEEGRFGQMSQCSAYVPWFRSAAYYASAGWRGTWELDGGGALMNQSIHAIDLLLWIAGDVKEVSARCGTALHHNIEVEDNAVAWLKFNNGAFGLIQGSTTCFPGEPKRLEIKGTTGSATLVDDTLTFWQFEIEKPEDELIRNGTTSAKIGGGASDPNAISVEGHRAQIEDFASAIREGRAPAIPGSEGRRTVELINAIYQSSRESCIVQL
ncbi:Gfo/Idh/MocA family protein [Abditibacterium utsteinense]|nr:Gfo/Idh/MocA family oxidoreductase [Abditibacterium utsteinense]